MNNPYHYDEHGHSSPHAFSSPHPQTHNGHHRPPDRAWTWTSLSSRGLILLLLMTQINVLVLFRMAEPPYHHRFLSLLLRRSDAFVPPNKTMEEYFQTSHHDQIRALVNDQSILSFKGTTDKFFQELNITAVFTPNILPLSKLHGLPYEEKMQIWRDASNKSPPFIWEANICFAARNFLQAGGVKRHVLFTYLNENRGAFSKDVPKRTAEWDSLATHWDKWGCTDEEIWAYLDHPNTRAVLTTQHQGYAHDKVHPIPLGVSPLIKDSIVTNTQLPRRNRTQLLMINDNGWRHRADVTRIVMKNFAHERPDLVMNNTYSKKAGAKAAYLQELRSSKFILTPSGLGWDCYRIWEAIYLGVIPIIETYDRPVDAWRDTLNDLPVLWVNHYDEVTPDMLQQEYSRLAARADEYKYEKLTNACWIEYFYSFLPEFRSSELTKSKVDDPLHLETLSSGGSVSHLLRYYYNADRNLHEIPRILHFIYLTPGLPEKQSAFPMDVQEHIDEWQRLHPDWMVVTWDNLSLRQEFPELASLVQPIRTMSWISNLLRYHVLERYGGVYLDVDIVPIRSLEPLRSRFQNFTACEQPESTGPLQNATDYQIEYCEMVNNNVIGVPRHNPALQDIIQLSVANTLSKLKRFPNGGGNYELKTTGPPIWSKSVKEFDLTMLHPSLFYPCNWNRKEKCRLELWKDEPHVYGMHEWKMSWYK